MNHEHIYQLLLQKRNGTISEPDDEYVTGLINVHEDIELMWKAIKHSPSIQGEEHFWHEMNTDAAWQVVEERLAPPPHRNMWWSSRWLIAALITGVVATGVIFIWHADKVTAPKPAIAAAVIPSKPGLQLTLANGEIVMLPYNNQANEQLTAGNVQLSAGAKKLQYTGTAEGMNTLEVPTKTDYKLVLSDGTEVWLNATSKLRFPFSFSGDKREVYLEGEAFFTVAKNAAQPFIVHTEKSDIHVLGTTFNVSAYKNAATTTALISGAVASKTGKTEVILKPGEEAVLKGDKFAVHKFDEDEVLAWTHGIYIFHNTTLTDIGGVIERWYGVKVAFDNPAIADKKFTGGLEKLQNLDYFLETLQIVGNVQHSYDKNGVLHFK
jgi:transmembrane sensor